VLLVLFAMIAAENRRIYGTQMKSEGEMNRIVDCVRMRFYKVFMQHHIGQNLFGQIRLVRTTYNMHTSCVLCESVSVGR
jgi:hypothetical protein